MAKIDNLLLKYRVQKRSADAIGKIDPTANGKYLDWLFKMKFIKRNNKYYVAPNFPANLHVPVRTTLEWMEKNNAKMAVEHRDINFFKDVPSLLSIISPLMVPSKKEIKEQVTKVMENEKWLLLIPKTFEASKLYGMNTKWCTTQRTYFSQYTRSNVLFYLIDKTHNRKFGIPINTNGNTTVINWRNVEVFNNEDKGLRWMSVTDIYGTELNPIRVSMEAHYKELMLGKVRTKVLTNAIQRLKMVKTEMTRDKIYENDEANKLIEELMKNFTNAMS